MAPIRHLPLAVRNPKLQHPENCRHKTKPDGKNQREIRHFERVALVPPPLRPLVQPRDRRWGLCLRMDGLPPPGPVRVQLEELLGIAHLLQVLLVGLQEPAWDLGRPEPRVTLWRPLVRRPPAAGPELCFQPCAVSRREEKAESHERFGKEIGVVSASEEQLAALSTLCTAVASNILGDDSLGWCNILAFIFLAVTSVTILGRSIRSSGGFMFVVVFSCFPFALLPLPRQMILCRVPGRR